MLKKIIQNILKILSKKILKKYKPQIIGVTGSVGKTFTKVAIATVLSSNFKVRAGRGSYNTEIGVPLAIIGEKTQGHRVLGWLKVFFRGLHLILKKDKTYPELLVLEMAADRPGDIKYLIEFTKPKIGVITAIGPTHLKLFGSVENILSEKSNIINYTKTDGCAVLNIDDKYIRIFAEKLITKKITYGLNSNADVFASDIMIDKETAVLSFKLNHKGSGVQVILSNILGKPQLYSVLSAVAVSLSLGLNLVKIVESLKNIKSMPGRLNILKGIKNTKIIDDSYNASPLSVFSALELLAHLNCSGNKFAILGDMLELGNFTENAHAEVGEIVVKFGIDYLITVGECATEIAASAKKYGMNPDRVFTFDNPKEAGSFIQDKMEEGDLLLIKGSAGVKMEKITKEIMAEPARAKELLVRQS